MICETSRYAIRALWSILLAVLAISFAFAGCTGQGGDAQGGPFNVLLVTLDTTRRDHLSCYGRGDELTPNFDALSVDGVRFDVAISPSASTPPSHASILTGLNPYQHGVRVIYAEGGYRLPESVPTLSTILRDRLWQTGAFVSSFTTSSFYGFDRGFDTFDQGAIDPSEESFVPQEEGFWAWSVRRDQRRSDETTDEAISWINQTEGPFFAWVHYWDPHDGVIVPPDGIMQQFVTSLGDQIERTRETYRAEVYFVDLQFGRLIRWLKKKEIYDETIIIVVADHGEGLGDHDWWSHRILYQEQIHVPLIMRVPGWPTGVVVEELVRTTDIVPTVLERLGIEFPPEGVAGSSLSGLVRGRSDAPRVAYADAINLFDLNASMVKRRPDDGIVYCAMDKEWKLIHRPLLEGKDELYNLSADPREQRNLMDFETAQADRLKKALDQFDGYVEKPFGDELDPKVLERLRSLGYIGNE